MNETFTLAHLSDLHLSSLNGVRIRELMNKRVFGYLKWQLRRRGVQQSKVLEALLRDLQSIEPDHIAITGDLTHLGLPREFHEVGQLLHSLGPPSQVTVIPGNHDAYVSTEWHDTFGILADYMVSDEPYLHATAGTNSRTTFPSLRVRGIAALIGLSTARPSALFLAVGSVGRIQLQELEKILAETGRQRLFRIVLSHHPPVAGTVSWRKRLTDGEALRSILTNRGVELVLHGHTHCSSMRYLETTVGKAPAIGVPSASPLSQKSKRRPRYHVYSLKRNPHGWEMVITARCYSPPSENFVEETESHLLLPRQVL